MMACEYCHGIGYHLQDCPEFSLDPFIATWCDECEEPIYEDETFYRIDGRKYCSDCIKEFQEVAELSNEYDFKSDEL